MLKPAFLIALKAVELPLILFPQMKKVALAPAFFRLLTNVGELELNGPSSKARNTEPAAFKLQHDAIRHAMKNRACPAREPDKKGLLFLTAVAFTKPSR